MPFVDDDADGDDVFASSWVALAARSVMTSAISLVEYASMKIRLRAD